MCIRDSDQEPRQLGRHVSRCVGGDRRAAGKAAGLWARRRALLHVRPPAFACAHRGPQLSFLAPLVPRLSALVALVVAFVALTLVVSAGWLASLDHQVQIAMSSLWIESLH